MEYRISLERVTRDSDGDRAYETVLELFGTAEQVATVGIGSVGAVLGVPGVSVKLDRPDAAPSTEAAPAAAVDKPARKPRKQAAPAASEPQPASAPAPVAEAAPAPTEPQAPTAPVLDAGQPPRPVNPFAVGG